MSNMYQILSFLFWNRSFSGVHELNAFHNTLRIHLLDFNHSLNVLLCLNIITLINAPRMMRKAPDQLKKVSCILGWRLLVWSLLCRFVQSLFNMMWWEFEYRRLLHIWWLVENCYAAKPVLLLLTSWLSMASKYFELAEITHLWTGISSSPARMMKSQCLFAFRKLISENNMKHRPIGMSHGNNVFNWHYRSGFIGRYYGCVGDLLVKSF